MQQKSRVHDPVYLEALRAAVSYCPFSGSFSWNIRRSPGVAAGNRCGTRTPQGRWQIVFMGRALKAHRVAWFLHTGAWPSMEIDHINGNPMDNRIENLREVTLRKNCHNRNRHRAGATPGVTWHRKQGKFNVRAFLWDGPFHIGCRPSEAEAIELNTRFWQYFAD